MRALATLTVELPGISLVSRDMNDENTPIPWLMRHKTSSQAPPASMEHGNVMCVGFKWLFVGDGIRVNEEGKKEL